MDDTPIFEADATGYHPVSEDDPNYKMEGGFKDKRGRAINTLDAYRRGEVPYVTVAGDPKIPYGSVLRSPQFPGVPFLVADTGGAFKGKGLSKFDIARDDAAGANSDENNRKIQFQISHSPEPMRPGLFAGATSPTLSEEVGNPANDALAAVPGALKQVAAAAMHNPIADRILQEAFRAATSNVTASLGNYAAGNGLNTGHPQSQMEEIARYMGSF